VFVDRYKSVDGEFLEHILLCTFFVPKNLSFHFSNLLPTSVAKPYLAQVMERSEIRWLSLARFL
jgi:hypothetical protein